MNRFFLWALVGWVAVASTAAAQSEVEDPRDEAAASAGVTGATETSDAPDEDPEPAPPLTEAEREAQERFAQGEAFFESGNYDAARGAYERAYELLEGTPRQYFLLYNIALCHERSFRYDLAMEGYRRYLEEGGPRAEARADVQASIRALENLLGAIEIESNVPADVWTDERQVGQAPGTVLLPAGDHVLEVRASGYESESVEVSVRPRDTLRRSVVLSELFAGISPGFFLATAGAAAVALGVAAFFGVRALVLENDLEDPVVAEDGEPIADAALAHDIFLVSGITLAAVATALLVLTDFGGSDEVELEVSLLPEGGVIGLRGAL
ncbi:MAG: PEGA domain-containing protein [Myxococcota bacterium]